MKQKYIHKTVKTNLVEYFLELHCCIRGAELYSEGGAHGFIRSIILRGPHTHLSIPVPKTIDKLLRIVKFELIISKKKTTV